MKYRYILIKSQIEPRICYGIAAVADFDNCTSLLQSYVDLSSEEKAVSDLVDACNRNELFLVHLRDVIDDFLTNR